MFYISIHTFLAEGDDKAPPEDPATGLFQSTPSSRKVTAGASVIAYIIGISIHTFLAEGDIAMPPFLEPLVKFQSTPSSRKVTSISNSIRSRDHISIHTFLAEGDEPDGGSDRVHHISIHTFLAEGDCKNIYNYFFIMHIFMHYILSYL